MAAFKRGINEMKDKLLLVGAGGFGRVVLEHASREYDCAFLDDGPEAGTVIDDAVVLGKTSDLARWYGEYKLLVVTIGNNALRERIYAEAREIGYSFPNIIHPSAYISPRAQLGSGIIILNNAVVQNGSKVGDGLIMNPGAELHQDSTVGSNVLIYTNSVVRSLTHVGDRAWIGANAVIGTRATLPDDARVEDGEVV